MLNTNNNKIDLWERGLLGMQFKYIFSLLTPASSISIQDQNDLNPFWSSSNMTAIGIKTRQMPAEDEQRFRRCDMLLSSGVWTLMTTMKNRRPSKFEGVSPALKIYLQCCFNSHRSLLQKLDLREILAEYNLLLAARDEHNQVADSNACNILRRSVSFKEIANKRDLPHSVPSPLSPRGLRDQRDKGGNARCSRLEFKTRTGSAIYCCSFKDSKTIIYRQALYSDYDSTLRSAELSTHAHFWAMKRNLARMPETHPQHQWIHTIYKHTCMYIYVCIVKFSQDKIQMSSNFNAWLLCFTKMHCLSHRDRACEPQMMDTADDKRLLLWHSHCDSILHTWCTHARVHAHANWYTQTHTSYIHIHTHKINTYM